MRTGRNHPRQRLIRDGPAITDRRPVILQPSVQVMKDDPGLNVRDGRVTREDRDGGREEVGSDLPGRGASEVRGGMTDTGCSEWFSMSSSEFRDEEDVCRGGRSEDWDGISMERAIGGRRDVRWS